MMYESLSKRLVSLELPVDEQALADVPPQVRHFRHGERTADLGTLGDDSGSIVLWPDTDGLGGANRIEWSVSAGVNAPEGSCSVPTSGTGSGDDGCVGGVGGRNGAINVYAGKPGNFYVQLFEVAGSGSNRYRGDQLGWQLLAVPQFVHVTTDQPFRDRVDAVAGDLSGGASAADRREAVLRKAKRVAAHVLRPANVRLVWDDLGDSLPAQFDADASESRNGIVTGVPDPDDFPGCAADHLVEVTLSGADGDPTVNEYGQVLSDGSPTGTVAVADGVAPTGDDATATAVRDHLTGLDDAEKQLERAARWLGVAVARSVLTGIGIEENEPVDADDAVERALYERALHDGDVMNPSPDAPLRDLLGVRTDDDPPDLVEAYCNELDVGTDDSGPLTVLDRTTPFDVLLGVVGTNPDDQQAQDGTLDQVEDEVPLGPPYGGWHLRAGDEDADGGGNPTYEGAERTDPNALPSGDEPGYVRLLQDDLRLLGIELPPAEGANGSGRMGGPAPGERDEDETLFTEWALREFQIALSYPQAALHRFQNEVVYGDNLDAIPNPTRVTSTNDDGTFDVEPAKRVVTGVVDSLTGYRLRRWRFRRARYPIVVEARETDQNQQGSYPVVATANGEALDNVWHSDAVGSRTPRVFVRDFSEHVDVSGDEEVEDDLWLHTLGDEGYYINETGPHMKGTNHGQVPLVPSNYHRTAEELTDLGNDELAVFEAVAAASFQETGGYFDVVNCYDYQALSHPLCHYVFGLGFDAEETGEWAGFLSYLHHVDEDLYMRFYGSRGVWPSNRYGKTGDGSHESAYTWRENHAKHVGVVYLLHRRLAADDQIDGDLAMRGTTGQGDTTVTQDDRRRYAQWFRTWHWMYRVVASLRDDQTLRRLTYEFAVRRLADIDDVEGLPESEFGAAMALRIHVRVSGTGLRMLRAASGEPTETDRIEAMLDDLPFTKATGTVEFRVANDGVVVPAGTEVGTAPDPDGNFLSYTTDNQVSPQQGSNTVTADVTAESEGESYDADPGNVTHLPAPPAGVQAVTNPGEISGGAREMRDEAEQAVEWPGGAVPGIDAADLGDLGTQESPEFDLDGDGTTDVTLTSRLSIDTDFPTGANLENFAAPLPSLPNNFDPQTMDRPWEWVEDEN